MRFCFCFLRNDLFTYHIVLFFQQEFEINVSLNIGGVHCKNDGVKIDTMNNVTFKCQTKSITFGSFFFALFWFNIYVYFLYNFKTVLQKN